MAWETALDRLILQQIHRAEQGEIRPQEVRQLVVDLWQLAEGRSATAFHLGYARTLLGIDLPEPVGSASTRRWYLFGRLRGHDRRGERNWVADLLAEPQVLIDLLGESLIASQCLPLVMRTLAWSGDLAQAVKVIQYLSAAASTPDTEVLVDAALTDLLTRLERREERDGQESTLSILKRCTEMPAFERLPQDVQARYHRELAARMLAGSAFEEALEVLEKARRGAEPQPLLRSSVDAIAALAVMRVHGIEELEPRADRPERDRALEILAHTGDPDEEATPDALFVRAILAYETGEYPTAAECLERALPAMRRVEGRDQVLINRSRFFLAAALLASGDSKEVSRAERLMEQALDTVTPDLESFYPVHEALKTHNRKLALRFLDAVDVGRGTSPDQLLFVALEYIGLGEAAPAASAAERVLEIAVDLDQRIEALRVRLTAENMRGDREAARATFDGIRDLLSQRGAFDELENLLKNEDFVGQALDHLEIKCEMAALYEEMEDREYDKAVLQAAIARSLRARKDTESLKEAFALLQEVAIGFPELAREDLDALEKLLELGDEKPTDLDSGAGITAAVAKGLGHAPRVLVVGGNERQRRHHPRFDALAGEWGLEGEWLMANYSSPQKLVSTIGDRLDKGVDLMVLLHWNRHETTEPALELARKADVPARTLHYAGFTSLQVCLTEMLGRLVPEDVGEKGGKGRKKSGSKG